MARPSIYDVLGGEQAFQRLAAALHERCVADPVLNHPFGRDDLRPDHTQRLGHYLAEVFGGPPRYSESYGDHSFVLGIHAHQGMDAELGERFVACFALAIDDAGFPSDPELRAALMSYLEHAVAEVYSYDPPESVVPSGAPVPRWSWDGLAST